MDVTIVPVGLLGTNCYLLQSAKKSCAVIDPGAQPQKLIGLIDAAKLTVPYILLTHGHHDHIGAVKQLMAHYPDAKLLIGEKDREMLEDTGKSLASVKGADAREFLIENAGTLTDGQELALDELTIRVLATPGHTRGGVVFLCKNVLFSGDTLFEGDCGRCDLYGGDYEVMKQSLKKLADLEGDYIVYPGHGGATTLEAERKNNRYMAEACL